MSSKVYIETFGCQMNVADTERAATGLRKAGYDIAASAEGADVVLLNTCSVRERAERKVFRRVGEIRKLSTAARKRPVIGVMGCVAQLEGEKIFKTLSAVDMVIGTQATDRIPSLIERAQNGEHRSSISTSVGKMKSGMFHLQKDAHLTLLSFRSLRAAISFVRFASFLIRGEGKRVAALQKSSTEVLRLRSLGYKEVHLIGQNVNSYRPKVLDGLEAFSGATPFSRLLRAVAATGMERIKFTTSFPRDFHPDIVSAIEECPNLCDWIHLPVQSGSDRILKAMRRGHTAADYLKRMERIKNCRRRLSLTSDIIVGFPGRD